MKKQNKGATDAELSVVAEDHDADLALKKAQRAVECSPDDAEAHLLLAELYEEAELFDQALAAVLAGLSHQSANEALLLKKASLMLDGFEDVDEAYAVLVELKSLLGTDVEVIKRDFDHELALDVFLLLTDCYRLKNDFGKAFEYATLALKLAPKDEAAILALATAHFELGDYRQALSLLEPIQDRQDQSDFYWQKAQVLCAMGEYAQADEAFLAAHKLDKGRYHRPIRMSQSSFFSAFEQATLVLPKEIRDFMDQLSIEIKDVMPRELLLSQRGFISPMSCVMVAELDGRPTLYLFQRSIENLALQKSDVRALIASALLHELAHLVLEPSSTANRK